jgi:chloramphenicol-sensitive protein RarD
MSRSAENATAPETAAAETKSGISAILGANAIWGFFPLFFKTVAMVDPVLVVAHRSMWAAVTLFGILGVRGKLGELKAVLQSRKAVLGLAVSTTLLAGNWVLFVYAVSEKVVLQISLAYFINPLISLALGMVLLGERLNRMQALAVGIATIGILLQTAGLGGVPWISLCLAGSFAVYGYVRKIVPVGASAGLLAETLLMLPLALGYLVYHVAVNGPGYHADPGTMFWLVMTGPVTSSGLVLFTFAARRLPLSTLGMFQYLAPSLHFITAVWLFAEPLNPYKLLSFAVIWLSLGLYTYDLVKRGRADANAQMAPEAR